MSEIPKLLKDIEELRRNLELLIEKDSTDLLDPNIIEASQYLDEAIAKYTKFISYKM